MDWKRMITSVGGLGWLRPAPGSWGSLPPAVLFFALMYWHVHPAISTGVFVALTVAASAACIGLAPFVVAKLQKPDPSEVVIDEVAGQALTLAVLPWYVRAAGFSDAEPEYVTFVALVSIVGWVSFRFFDILKPWPARQLERLSGGYGILMDDLMAGVYASLVTQALAWLLMATL